MLTVRLAATINGPAIIHPGVATAYTWGGGVNQTWSCVDANGATVGAAVLTVAQSGLSANLTINKSVVLGTCSLKVVYTSGSSSVTDIKVIEIQPFIQDPANFAYPGESLNLTILDNNAGAAQHNACFFTWSSPGPLTCGGSCNNSSSNVVALTPPSSGFATSYAVNCTQKCGLGAYQYVCQPVTVQVKLRDPVITGQIAIGCSVPSTLVYSCSQPAGAGYYTWIVPSGWTINSGQGSTSINVTTSGAGAGQVKVKASASNGSSVESLYAVQNVVCCTANLAVNTNVSTGNTDNKEADISINATNTIQNGATARYHAREEVRLSPGFSSVLGSTFHAYNLGCTNTFASRTFEPDPEVLNESPANTSYNYESVQDNPGVANAVDIGIFPNPNNGYFTIQTSTKEIKIVKVMDILGNLVFEGVSEEDLNYNIDLSNELKGVYFVHILYGTKTTIKKIIVD